MKRALFALALLALGAGSFNLSATAAAKLSDKPIGKEIAFVTGIQHDLNTRFSTPADAEKAGYFRFTNEDDTGAISYANLHWTSADPQHPSQLWYDVKGNLLGADFSVPLTKTPPHLWGVNPARWSKFGRPHVHYILTAPAGNGQYGHAVSGRAFVKAGGSLADPQAATIVKLGKAKSASTVAKVFTFPAEWDLIVWVKANPSGAFADKNPLVHPTKNAGMGSM
ncbi:MAG TPA: hypothetical protein VIG32_08070 [Candidatus Baltobacteraceae bacterium]|jgi:hypothetical protein